MNRAFYQDMLCWCPDIPPLPKGRLSRAEKQAFSVSLAFRLLLRAGFSSAEVCRNLFLKAWALVEPLGSECREAFAHALLMGELLVKEGVLSTGTRPVGPMEPYSASPELVSIYEGMGDALRGK